MKKNDPTPSVIPDIVIIARVCLRWVAHGRFMCLDMGYFCVITCHQLLFLQLSNLVGVARALVAIWQLPGDLRSQGLF